ncbi:glycoside hydrolase family 5 protein [Parvularcula dongshanensis]|uniref:Endoglucanase n=1 Tax=Parvularcula dongshanensis TaxID=1173995 RepID=A0A840I3F2_9PROT|nr:glycoside hydrolase family 5 protein [Parvularcula dongshanensis]MBB4658855.1 endoglucanase [Parvularcula dongshanensis]
MSLLLRALPSLLAAAAAPAALAQEARTPVERHGALSVEDGGLVDEKGDPVSLAGVSFFWSNTGWAQERFYDPAVVERFAEDWGVSLVRAAIGVDAGGGLIDDPEGNRARAEAVIEGAIDAGVYVVLDWHSHHAEDHPDEAVAFFTDMAKRYGDAPNLIYEVYNEPLDDADWSATIKPYAERVIGAIRAVDPDNPIVVGTPTWSQDVDDAAADPIEGQENVLYTLHFYAGSHKESLRARAQAAIDGGLPIFVTEWGTVNADGDGAPDTASTRDWVGFMRENCLSHANWSVSDKQEGAALFRPGTPAEGPWPDEALTPSGRLVKSILADWQTACAAAD